MLYFLSPLFNYCSSTKTAFQNDQQAIKLKMSTVTNMINNSKFCLSARSMDDYDGGNWCMYFAV